MIAKQRQRKDWNEKQRQKKLEDEEEEQQQMQKKKCLQQKKQDDDLRRRGQYDSKATKRKKKKQQQRMPKCHCSYLRWSLFLPLRPVHEVVQIHLLENASLSHPKALLKIY